MSLQIMTNINVDFYDNKYILINAKQYDGNSRWISVTCYDQGKPFNLNSSKHTVYVKCRKADGHGVLNSCRINYKGEILVELTEQMLAASGICYVDLIVVNKGKAIIDLDAGTIIAIDNSAIVSTMTFCINVHEASIDNSVVESSCEYNALNELLQKVDTDYKEVIQLARSYAIGDTDGIRENEDIDNAKYYYEQSAKYANLASINADNSFDNAEVSRSYAVGDTGIRLNEDTDNARYYYQSIKNIVNSINNSFIPMGTITFSELVDAEKATGYVYNISDDFITDDSFREGAGKSYTAGTNVYYTASGHWDCFGGAASPTSTVDEVKEYLGI